MSDKYSIGTGSVGDDSFDPMDPTQNKQDDTNLASPQQVGGLFDGLDNSSVVQDNSNNNKQNPKFTESFSDRGTPDFSTNSSGVPDFLVGDLNNPGFLDTQDQDNQQDFNFGPSTPEVQQNVPSNNVSSEKDFEFTLDQNIDSKPKDLMTQTVPDPNNFENNDFSFDPIPSSTYSDPFMIDTSVSNTQPNPNQNYDSYEFSVPANSNNNSYNYSSGSSSLLPKILFTLFVATVSAFVFFAVNLNNYVPKYESLLELRDKEYQVSSLKDSTLELQLEVQDLYSVIDSDAYLSDDSSQDSIESDYWQRVNTASNKSLISFDRTLDAYNNLRSSIVGYDAELQEVEDDLVDIEAYIDFHIDISDFYVDVDSMISNSNNRRDLEDKLNEQIQRLNTYRKFGSLENSGIIDFYIENIEVQRRLLNNINLSKEFFDEDVRRQDERFAYSQTTGKLEDIQRQLDLVESSLQEDIRSFDIPDYVVEILDQIRRIQISL